MLLATHCYDSAIADSWIYGVLRPCNSSTQTHHLIVVGLYSFLGCSMAMDIVELLSKVGTMALTIGAPLFLLLYVHTSVLCVKV